MFQPILLAAVLMSACTSSAQPEARTVRCSGSAERRSMRGSSMARPSIPFTVARANPQHGGDVATLELTVDACAFPVSLMKDGRFWTRELPYMMHAALSAVARAVDSHWRHGRYPPTTSCGALLAPP